MPIQFNKKFECEYGVAQRLSPMVRRVVANNPSPFTFYGTGTYIVGNDEVAVIDPGPDDPNHINALLTAVAGERITHILVTHTHLDHSPGCRILQKYTEAKTYGYGPHGSGRILENESVEEGADRVFTPDIRVADGDEIHGNGWSFECVHTPGHTSNHVCYQLRGNKILFCGDHVMAWSTTIISPPDGDLSRYLHSLEMLLDRDDELYWPCHGPAIDEPKPFVRDYIKHRYRRIEEVLTCLRGGVRNIPDMVPIIYTGLPVDMYPAAARSVLSTLIYLCDQGIAGGSRIELDGDYHLTGHSA